MSGFLVSSTLKLPSTLVDDSNSSGNHPGRDSLKQTGRRGSPHLLHLMTDMGRALWVDVTDVMMDVRVFPYRHWGSLHVSEMHVQLFKRDHSRNKDPDPVLSSSIVLPDHWVDRRMGLGSQSTLGPLWVGTEDWGGISTSDPSR